MRVLLQIAGTVFIAGLAFSFLSQSGSSSASEGLAIGQIQASGSNVSMVISNSSAISGRIGLWIEQDDIRKCEHFFDAMANTRYTFTIRCPTLNVG